MNKFWKKIAVLALAGTMTLGMSVNALAAETNLNTNSTNITDTETINLIKDYDVGSNNQASTNTVIGEKIPTKSPKEIFTFTITGYGLWNVGQDGKGNGRYTKDKMPLFDNNVGSDGSATNIFKITANAGEAESDNKLFVILNVPT